MIIPLSLFDLLIIIGMVTGIICSILLFNKSNKKPSNKFLGLGILGFVWLNTKTLLHSLDLWEIHGLGFFPNGIELALPPLFYFYITSLIQSPFKFSKKDWLHFVPFFLSQGFAIVVYIATMQTHILSEKELIGKSFYFIDVKNIEEHLVLISLMIYLYLGYRHLQNYKSWLLKNTSDTQLSELGFLRNLCFGFLFMAIYNISNLILNHFLEHSYYWRWQLSHLIIATLVYYMGLVGYKNSDVIPQGYSLIRDKKNKKSDELIDLNIIAKLNHAIEIDKVHLNPKLNLRELAKILEVKESILSNMINTHYQKNFRSFINEARVEEIKKVLINEGMGNLSLLGLARECGFNSEASFYRIFKSITGLTPKQFLAEQSSSNSQKKQP